MLGSIDVALAMLRSGFFALAAALAILCTVDWLVRTRRLDPFGALARFMRSNIHPLMAPVERRVVKAGGVPSSAPWWALGFVVLTGILLISFLEFTRGQVAYALAALDGGGAGIYRLAVSWTFAFLQLAIIVRVIISWVPVTPGHWAIRWAYRVSEPLLRPLRQFIPPLGLVDITPIVAWFLLSLLRGFLLRVV